MDTWMNAVGTSPIYIVPMSLPGTINYPKPNKDKNNDALDAMRYSMQILGHWPEREDK